MRHRTRPQKATDPFYYSAAWRRLRAQALRRDGWRCVACGSDVSAPGSARIDHKLARSAHPELALELANLRTLCAACDNQAHREKGTGGSDRQERFAPAGCDVDGTPIDPGHPWNR